MVHLKSYRRPVLVISLMCVVSLARAETITHNLTGSSLSLTALCAATVQISPSTELKDSVSVTATADHQAELDRLVFTSGAVAKIEGTNECAEEATDKERTLSITIEVPPRTALQIRAGGNTSYILGDIDGPLQASLHGHDVLKSGRLSSLKLGLSGKAKAEISQLNGDGSIELRGTGRVTVESGTISTLNIAKSGTGELDVASGTITNLVLKSYGAGTINIDAIVNNESLSTSGHGTIRIPHVTGTVRQYHK